MQNHFKNSYASIESVYILSLEKSLNFWKRVNLWLRSLPCLCQWIIVSLDQRIALHVAVEGGYVDTVRFLVDEGADDINSKDKNGVSIYR